MKKRTAYRILLAGTVFFIGFLLYCGSALRPFFVALGLTIEASVPGDAMPAVGKLQTYFRIGQKPSFSFPAYLRMLGTPSKHEVRNIVVRYPMDDAVLIQDLNSEFEVALLNLGGKWKQGPSGPGLNTVCFNGQVIGEQAEGQIP